MDGPSFIYGYAADDARKCEPCVREQNLRPFFNLHSLLRSTGITAEEAVTFVPV